MEVRTVINSYRNQRNREYQRYYRMMRRGYSAGESRRRAKMHVDKLHAGKIIRHRG